MKKALLLLLMLPAILLAAPVDPNLAQQVANNFINAPESSSNNAMLKAPRKLKRMTRAAKQVTNDQQFYIFNSEDGEGFVIVAANDVVRPILGYSRTNSFNYNDIQDGMKWWLSEYSKQIRTAINRGIKPSEEVEEEWSLLKTNSSLAATEIVSPLVTTKWGQAPYYNNKCPFNYLLMQRTVTGCAATALAQVMNFWEWPQIGSGYHSYNTFWYGTQSANFGATYYDWDNMPNQLTSSSSSTQVNAVATLMYHCGVSMDMDYGFNVSGIRQASQVVNAVTSYFRYSSSTHAIHKSDYSEANWISTIKSQLDASKPMVYIGIGSGGGHAFVCDGYDSRDYFHFNWGWSGDKDGFYPVSDLAPGPNGYGSGTTGDFTADQWVIVDMVPRTASANVANLQLNSSWYLSSDSIPYGGTLAAAVSVKNYGTTSFVGDIIAMVLDKDGNYFADYVIEQNCTIAKNATKTINPSVSGNAGLVPGRYYVALFCRSNDLGYQIIGSEYYLNLTTFKVYYQADIETYSDFAIYSDDNNQLITGHQSQISLTMKNTGTSSFRGTVALVLYTSDLSVGQDYDEISLSLTGIGVGATRTLTFSGTVNLDPGTYILALAYKDNNGNVNFAGSTYYSNPVYVIVKGEGEDQSGQTDDFELAPGKYVIVASRAKEGDRNWYYMTSDLGTASTKRFQAVSTGTESMDAIDITDLEDKYVWTLEADGSNWKLKNGTQYVTWTSGNSANLGTTAKSLTFDVADNQVQAHFNDGTVERYLSLNATTNNNYFAFYGNTNQVTHLFFLPYDDGTTPVEPPVESDRYIVLAQRNATSNWFYMTSDLGTALNKRYQAVDAGTSSLANVISSSLEDKYYWEIEDDKLKTTAGYSTWTSGNSANLDATGRALEIQQLADGTYTFSFIEGENTRYLAFNKTEGNNYFAYYVGTNQIYKLTLVKEGEEITPQALENTSAKANAVKLLRNGQILILRGEKVYTLDGREVK